MTPQTYNAYYNPSNNEIVLPAAIFTMPGVADAKVDDAVAYGYAGASHDRPRDHARLRRRGPPVRREGQPSDWWTAQDAERFNAARRGDGATSSTPTSRCHGLHINGQASLGENIADYGGAAAGPRCLQEDRAVQEGQDDRRADAAAALLPRLRDGLDEPAERAAPARRPAERRPRAGQMARARTADRTSPSSTRRSAFSRASRCGAATRSGCASGNCGDRRRPCTADGCFADSQRTHGARNRQCVFRNISATARSRRATVRRGAMEAFPRRPKPCETSSTP